MRTKKLATVVVSIVAATSFLAATPDAGATASDPTGKYHAVTPSRIADSRTGWALPMGGVRQDTSASLAVAGRGGVPGSGVQAVVVNITAIDPTSGGWVTAYAGGATKPWTSVLTYPKGWTGATTATVPVGADGTIRLAAGGASVQLAVDVLGWFAASSSTVAAGSLYTVNEPERWFDSRYEVGGSRLAPGEGIGIPLSLNESGGRRLTAMQFNMTATGGYDRGWFTAWSGAGEPPSTSSVNFVEAETSANLVTVPVRRIGADPARPGYGQYAVHFENTSNSSAHLILDAVGSFVTDPGNIGTVRVPVGPTRIGDTRTGLRFPQAKVGAQQTVSAAVPSTVDSDRTHSFEGILTAANPTRATFLTLFGAGEARPTTSMLNTKAAHNRSNSFVSVPGCLSPSGATTCTPGLSVFNQSGSVDLVLDITGRFELTDEAIAQVKTQSPARSGATPSLAPVAGKPHTLN